MTTCMNEASTIAMAASTRNLLDILPTELIEHVVTFVEQASPPPSTLRLREPPTPDIFKGMPSASHRVSMSLKSLSETCWTFRDLVAPKLFAHLKGRGEEAERLVDFCKSKSFSASPKSILLYFDPLDYPALDLSDTCPGQLLTDFDPLCPVRASATWMVDVVNPQALIMVAPPKCLGWLMDLSLKMSDCWVVNVPLQMMRLEQGPLSPVQWFPHDTVHDNKTLSTVRPWNYCTYNEGSFVPAYSTYEYHIYEAPSLHQSDSMPELECHALQLGCLRSFELVAVFPFNHVEGTVYFLSHLPNLQRLSVQLAPSLECQQREVIGTSASCPGDFWLELELNYSFLRDLLNLCLPSLSLYDVLDYASPGYRSIVDSAMAKVSGDWKPNHKGTWTREVKVPVLNTAPTRTDGGICPTLAQNIPS